MANVNVDLSRKLQDYQNSLLDNLIMQCTCTYLPVFL